MSATVIPQFLKTFRNILREREGLEGVYVANGALGNEVDPHEGVALLGADANSEWAQLGRNQEGLHPRREFFTVEGVLWAVKQGAGQEKVDAAQDRATVLLEEVSGALREDPSVEGVTQLWAALGSASFDNTGITEDGRLCQVRFTINVTARI